MLFRVYSTNRHVLVRLEYLAVALQIVVSLTALKCGDNIQYYVVLDRDRFD